MHYNCVAWLNQAVVVNRNTDHFSEAIGCLMVFLRGADIEVGISELPYVIVPPQTNWFNDEAVW